MSMMYMGEVLRYPNGDPIPDRLFCSTCEGGKAQCRPDRAACSILYHRHRADVAEAKLRIAERKLMAQTGLTQEQRDTACRALDAYAFVREDVYDDSTPYRELSRQLRGLGKPGEIIDPSFADDDQGDVLHNPGVPAGTRPTAKPGEVIDPLERRQA